MASRHPLHVFTSLNCVATSAPSRHHPLTPIFFFNTPATTEIYTLSLHDALPISMMIGVLSGRGPTSATPPAIAAGTVPLRSEEHTSELQSRFDLVCRLLLEKKKKKQRTKE